MSKPSSGGARGKKSSDMGSSASQVDPLKSKRGPSSVYSSTLSSSAKSAASDGSSTTQRGTHSGGAARGVANTAGYQTRSRIAAVNVVRGYGPIKTSPRDDVNIKNKHISLIVKMIFINNCSSSPVDS